MNPFTEAADALAAHERLATQLARRVVDQMPELPELLADLDRRERQQHYLREWRLRQKQAGVQYWKAAA